MQTTKIRKRLSSGEKTLDEMLGGGFIESSATLVSGAPGVGKTTLGLQFLCAGAAGGEPGVLVTFEEFPATLIRDAKQMGWDLQQLQADGLLRIIFTSPDVFLSSLQAPDSPLAETIRTIAPTRAVIDSVTQFTRTTEDPFKLRAIHSTLINALKRESITSLLLAEDAHITHTETGTVASLPYVVDSVLLMRYVEVDSAMRRALTILKMRGSRHAKEIRGYEITSGGLHMQEPFEKIRGLLSGITRRVK